jgi:hypothetical protein
VESKWKNYHIITFPGQSLSKTLEEAMDLSQDRLILELEHNFTNLKKRILKQKSRNTVSRKFLVENSGDILSR